MEPTCKMEIESTDAENNFMVTKGGLGGGINQETQYYLQNTHYYIKKKKKDNQQGSTAQHREPHSILC